tara:strand:- start:1097 stop:1777 length:681 start_codon:yes stop_codon:yes gene_type:complete
MKPIIIFGAGKVAQIIHFFFSEYTQRKIISFCVDSKYKTQNELNNIPIIEFDHLIKSYPPSAVDIFVAMGYKEMNKSREEKYKLFKGLGYTLTSYIDTNSNIPKNCIIGENCFLMSNVIIHPFVKIGNNVFIWGGSMVGHHSQIEDHTWITSSTSISGNSSIGRNCFLGLNSSIGNSIKIADYCFIGANSLIIKSTKHSEVFITAGTKSMRLNSEQFTKLSNFDSI